MKKDEMKAAVRETIRRYVAGEIDIEAMEHEIVATIDAGNVSIYQQPDEWIHLLSAQLGRYVHAID